MASLSSLSLSLSRPEYTGCDHGQVVTFVCAAIPHPSVVPRPRSGEWAPKNATCVLTRDSEMRVPVELHPGLWPLIGQYPPALASYWLVCSLESPHHTLKQLGQCDGSGGQGPI